MNQNIEAAVEKFRTLLASQLERVERMKADGDFTDYSSLDTIRIGVCGGDGIGPIISKEAERVLRFILDDMVKDGRVTFVPIDGLTLENRIAHNKGIPDDVLSGGRYDRLMRKMNRTSDAIGFAVYLDRLAGYYTTAPGEYYETVLLYDDQTDVRALNEKMEECAVAHGKTVAVRELPEAWRVDRVIDMRGGKCDE